MYIIRSTSLLFPAYLQRISLHQQKLVYPRTGSKGTRLRKCPDVVNSLATRQNIQFHTADASFV